MKTKICSKCKEKFPATLKYFSPNKSAKDKLHSQCRECKRIYAQKYRQQYPILIKKQKHKYRQTEKGKLANKRGSMLFRQRHPDRIKRYYNTVVGRLRHVYNGMKKRCNNPEREDYKWYGERGIKCLFNSSNEFVDYVINVLKVDPRGLTIDRIDNNGHYEKGNIRFVTHQKNCSNRRKKKLLGE